MNQSRRSVGWFMMAAIASSGLASGILHGSASAQAIDEGSAIEVCRTALGRGARFPWYDAVGDQPRALPAPDRGSLPGAPSWTAQPQARQRRDWNLPLEATWRVFQVILWVLLAVVLAWALYFALNVFSRRRLITVSPRASVDEPLELNSELIQRLPFAVKQPTKDLLGEARRHYQQGNFRDAIIYLYSYQLLQLDRHQLIQLARGKTNRQYLAEIRPRKPLRSVVARVMRAFEEVFFGHHDLERQRFETIWHELPEFERLLQSERT